MLCRSILPLLISSITLLALSPLTQGNDSRLFDNRHFSTKQAPFWLMPRTFHGENIDLNEDGHNDLMMVNNIDGARGFAYMPGDGAGGFGEPVNFVMDPQGFYWMAEVLDLNGDNHLDIIMPSRDYDRVEVSYGDGHGGFGPYRSFPAGDAPLWIELGDFDEDGALDVAVMNLLSEDISILINDGAGSFTSGPTLDSGLELKTITVGDWTGDGHLDVIASGSLETDIAIRSFEGDGMGGFGVPQEIVLDEFGTGSYVQVHDLNRDGHTDLLLSVSSQAPVEPMLVFLGDGQGGVLELKECPSGRDPSDFEIRDIDGDGHDDVITTNWDWTLTILHGDSTGNLVRGRSVACGGFYMRPAVADFDGDGDLDMASADYYESKLHIYYQNDEGEFSNNLYWTGTRTQSMRYADLNDDGHLDLLAVSETLGQLSFLPGDGRGGFGSPTHTSSGIRPHELVLEDMNGDGLHDALLRDSLIANLFYFHVGAGYGTFGAPQPFMVTEATDPRLSLVDDMNGDGIGDLLIADNRPSGSHLMTCLGYSWGGFGPPADYAVGKGTFQTAVSGDFDLDGHTDVVLSEIIDLPLGRPTTPGRQSIANTRITFLKGDGQGSFASRRSKAIVPFVLTLAKGDIDQDGRLDLVASCFDTREDMWGLGVLLGDGAGLFSLSDLHTSKPGNNEFTSFALGDVNVDGKTDIVASSYSSVQVFLGDGQGKIAQEGVYATARDPYCVRIADLDEDGFPDLTVGSKNTNTVMTMINRSQ